MRRPSQAVKLHQQCFLIYSKALSTYTRGFYLHTPPPGGALKGGGRGIARRIADADMELADVPLQDLMREVQRRFDCTQKPKKHLILFGAQLPDATATRRRTSARR